MRFLVLTRKPLLAELTGWLGEHTATTVVVTGPVPADQAVLTGRFRHVEQVPDYDDERVGSTVVELAAHHGVERIGSLNEVDVLRAAAARQVLGLPGQRLPSAVAFRDKHVMKSIVTEAGIPVARMRRATGRDRARAAAGDLGYPVVVKPVDGGGSVGVRRLDGPADWAGIEDGAEYLVEDLVDEAAFFIVDGLMHAGRVTQRVVLRMLSGNLTFLVGGAPVAGRSVCEGSATSARVTEFTDRVVRAMPPVPHEMAFHLELFAEPDGRLVLCEIAARPGGMGHAPTFRDATGVDLNAASLLGQLELVAPHNGVPQQREAGFAYFPRREGTLVRHPDRLRHRAVSSYSTGIQVGTTSGSAQWVGDSIARIHLTAPMGTDLERPMSEVVAEYEAGTEWTADAVVSGTGTGSRRSHAVAHQRPCEGYRRDHHPDAP